MVKNLPANAGYVSVQSLGQEDPLEKEMAIHSSILAWKNPMDRGALWAAVHGVPKSRTRPSMHTGTAVLYPLEFYRTNLCLEIDKNYAL